MNRTMIMALALAWTLPAYGQRAVTHENSPLFHRTGNWIVTAGPFYTYLEARFSDLHTERAHAGGGFLAVEHVFHRAFTMELAVHVTPEVETRLFGSSVVSTDDRFTATADLQAFFPMLNAKLYPFQFTERLRDWRFQPFLSGGIGVLILPVSLQGQYTGFDETALVRTDLNEAAGMWNAGAGLDVRLSRRFGLFLDGRYYESFAEPRARILLTPTGTDTTLPIRLEAFVARLGVRFAF